MAYETALQALADPTRRAIVENLRAAPQPVGHLAKQFPISRPAISQHLRVLSEAGIVEARADGTRRVYSLSPDGLGAVREYLDTLWGDALSNYALAAHRQERATRKETP